MNNKEKYYDLGRILKLKAHYNIVIGERSNGKTYATLSYLIEDYYNNGNAFGYIRRWGEDIKQYLMKQVFDSLTINGVIEKITNGVYNSVKYKNRCFYLYKFDDELNTEIVDDIPCGYVFALSEMERDKSISFERVRNILFEEFLTRKIYIPDEFVIFMQLLSTIIRNKDNVKIFMLANTISKQNPYFSEMGLTHAKNMKPGDIEVYTYGNSGLKVAIEFSDSIKKFKKSNVYFAFDNPKLNVITGNGNSWEMNIYPRLKYKYLPKNIIFNFYIMFDNETMVVEYIQLPIGDFLYIHPKTTPLKYKDTDIIYTIEPSQQENIFNNLLKCSYQWQSYINELIKTKKVFFSSNEVGELFTNYINWCKSNY